MQHGSRHHALVLHVKVRASVAVALHAILQAHQVVLQTVAPIVQLSVIMDALLVQEPVLAVAAAAVVHQHVRADVADYVPHHAVSHVPRFLIDKVIYD